MRKGFARGKNSCEAFDTTERVSTEMRQKQFQ